VISPDFVLGFKLTTLIQNLATLCHTVNQLSIQRELNLKDVRSVPPLQSPF